MLYFAEGLSHRNVCGLCCQAGAGTGLSRAFPLSPEFIVIHNGIITNYKDLRKFLVSDPWGLRPSLLSHSPLLSHPSWLTPPLVFSLSLSHLHSPLVPFLHSHCSTGRRGLVGLAQPCFGGTVEEGWSGSSFRDPQLGRDGPERRLRPSKSSSQTPGHGPKPQAPAPKS